MDDAAIFHVTNRGNNRAAIFCDDEDYARFLRMFVAAFADLECIRHAYCLIPNHYHLLIEIGPKRLAKAMHLLNGRYARRFNVRHRRIGHLFQGPYRVTPVGRDEHLLEAVRYILLNPVRAGLCSHPAQWRWSSYAEEPTALIRSLLGDRERFEAFVLALA